LKFKILPIQITFCFGGIFLMEKIKSVSINQSNNQSKGGNKMNKSLFKKVVATAVAFGIAATAFSTQSFASTTSTVSGGDLTGGGVGFTALSTTLTGSQITTSANWTIGNVSDARGTGAGWNVSMSLAQFKEYDTVNKTYVTGGKTLATSSLKVSTVPTIAKIDPTSSETTTITPVDSETALDTGSPVKLVSAALHGGMGSFSFGNLGVTLTIPANAYAKTYKTEATVSLNTAP
jgi:WxL domain surface cell wall-binding